MDKNFKILIAGGDMRQMYCAESLAEKYDVYVKGFDREHFPDSMKSNELKNETDIKFDCAVLPVPPLDDDGMLSAPCFSGKISAYDIKKMLLPESVVFAGRTDGKLAEIFDDSEICDYMLREELSLRNAVPTAEGAVQIALEELPVTLNGLKVLIIGMGRIGTALAEILKGFGADITVAVRNRKGAARASIHGVKAVYTNKIDTDYGLVFNTVPTLIFDRSILADFGKETLFIDLASKPGGIDISSAAELGIKVIWALGLPGKTAPVTSGEIIAETIDGMLGERRETNA